MMLMLVFMFQATQVYYEYIAKLDRNEFIPSRVSSGADAWKPDALDVSDPNLDASYILFFGDEEGEVGNTVAQWCTYTKRNLVVCGDLKSFKGKIGKNQEYVLIESDHLDARKDLKTLEKFSDAGVRIIFCDLPDAEEISTNSQLRQILGIRKIRDREMTAEGIRIFKGFLLGGEVTYGADDKIAPEDLEMPWYQLKAGAQTYMVGLLDEKKMNEQSITREMLPALMWSYSDGNSSIFAVNGDYLHDNTGVGILSAIDAQLSEYALYPVLDAQVLTVANYPGLANENREIMYDRFSGDLTQIGRDLVFPQLMATADQTGFVMSCMLQTQYDYQDSNYPKVDAFKDYKKLMKQAGAEMGLSLDRTGNISVTQKLEEDNQFMKMAGTKYQFGAVYASQDTFDDVSATTARPYTVNTVVSLQDDRQDLVAFGNDRLTLQTITADASVHTYRSDLYMRSVQTALAYTNALMDLNKVFWPGEDDLRWEKLSKVYADNLYTDWRDFQAFEDVTVSRSDEKIRQLLTMDYSHVRKENVIYLELEDATQGVSFVLRLQNAVPDYVSGGTCIELEEGSYLIRTTEQFVEIHLTSSNPIHN